MIFIYKKYKIRLRDTIFKFFFSIIKTGTDEISGLELKCFALRSAQIAYKLFART
jgi:hypothetical protein